jgi:hypothetical protein
MTAREDVLDAVLLSTAAIDGYYRWMMRARLVLAGVPPASIPDERAEVDGEDLLIVVDAPEPVGRLVYRVLAGDWTWTRSGGDA